MAAEEVIILAGGPGTRLREAVPDQPKVMRVSGASGAHGKQVSKGRCDDCPMTAECHCR